MKLTFILTSCAVNIRQCSAYNFKTNVIYLFMLLNQRDTMSSSAHYQTVKNFCSLFSCTVLWCNLISFVYRII